MKRGTETTRTKGKYKRPKTEVNFIDQSNLETEERDVEGDRDNWECFKINYTDPINRQRIDESRRFGQMFYRRHPDTLLN